MFQCIVVAAFVAGKRAATLLQVVCSVAVCKNAQHADGINVASLRLKSVLETFPFKNSHQEILKMFCFAFTDSKTPFLTKDR